MTPDALTLDNKYILTCENSFEISVFLLRDILREREREVFQKPQGLQKETLNPKILGF